MTTCAAGLLASLRPGVDRPGLADPTPHDPVPARRYDSVAPNGARRTVIDILPGVRRVGPGGGPRRPGRRMPGPVAVPTIWAEADYRCGGTGAGRSPRW